MRGPTAILVLCLAAGTGCVAQATVPLATSTTSSPTSPTTAITSTTEAHSEPALAPTRPEWLGKVPLETNSQGEIDPRETPPRLLNRAFPSHDTLPPPVSTQFESSVTAFAGEPLTRSSHYSECPVQPQDLRYLTLTFWGFDGRAHTGEMVVHADVAADVVSVFAKLFDAKFPIEEMRIATTNDFTKPPTGDANNTSGYECRKVTGGQRWSDHALGTAIDVNPFHNPYVRGGVVLPELAEAYLDRTNRSTGMISPNDVVVEAFRDIGWGWGGNWNSLKDWQHFSLSGR